MRTKVTDLKTNIEWIQAGGCLAIGIIHLQDGTVVIYDTFEPTKGITTLIIEVNHNGKLYTKSIHREYSRRFCTTLAKRFMAEVIAKSSQEK